MMRVDPVGAYNFLVLLVDSSSALATQLTQIDASPAGGFSECSGLEAELEIESYPEGGENGRVLKFPTRVKWGSIRLRRGVALSDDLWLWHHGFVEGGGTRRDGVIVLLDERREMVKKWKFTRGLPAKWSGPSLDAARSGVAIEELEIVHEGLELVSGGGS
jgi:phage tail-like protein